MPSNNYYTGGTYFFLNNGNNGNNGNREMAFRPMFAGKKGT